MNSEQAELAIDEAFAQNRLQETNQSQAIWTLLSVVEDIHLKAMIIDQRSEKDLHVLIENTITAVTYPLRVLISNALPTDRVVCELVDQDYDAAVDWLEKAEQYTLFCLIFPLWHRNRVTIEIDGSNIVTAGWREQNFAYEAYNRLRRKNAKERPLIEPSESLLLEIQRQTRIEGSSIVINYDPKFVAYLLVELAPTLTQRYDMPGDWQTLGFTFREFTSVFTTVQVMMIARVLSRFQFAANIEGLGYSSSVWLVEAKELVLRLRRYTNLSVDLIELILNLLTFGSSNIRTPDIATQPVVDLGGDYYALSPFIWMNLNAERNLCALLNQIPDERVKYLEQVDRKEEAQRQEITTALEQIGLQVISGSLDNTDVDCAIIDRNERICLAVELKWFIEPSEIREVIARSVDLGKGVEQAAVIQNLFREEHPRLLDLLGIDSNYQFQALVGSQNWIGHSDIQCDEVPIVKVWHLVEVIQQSGLAYTIDWLRNRGYLPVEHEEFQIVETTVQLDDWVANWYGLEPLVATI